MKEEIKKIRMIDKMPRLQVVWKHPLYQEHYKKIQEIECTREYCHHDMEHFLDVARIAYIRNLELHLGFSKELIYTAAILHDIGKDRQYEEGIPHEIASAEIADEILHDIRPAYLDEEIEWILQSIRGHRRKKDHMAPIERLFFWSDKRSRKCFACPMEKTCNWNMEEKNMEINI